MCLVFGADTGAAQTARAKQQLKRVAAGPAGGNADAIGMLVAADAGEKMRKFSQYPDFRGPQAFAREVQEDRTFFKGLIDMIGITAQ